MIWRRNAVTAVLCAVLAVLAPAAAIAAPTPPALRVCADPDNLPFSSDQPEKKGVYLEIADLVARDLGIPLEVFWWRTYFGKRAMRLTLLAGRCDLHLGLPARKGFMGRKIAVTKPLFELGYALVVPKGMAVSTLSDLKGKTVAVLFNTPAQNVITSVEGIGTFTVKVPDEAMAALARGDADAAFIWGLPAGYYNKTVLKSAYRLIPTTGPRLTWRVAIGVRGEDQALRALLDQQIAKHRAAIDRIAVKYGLPGGPSLRLDWLPEGARSEERDKAEAARRERQAAVLAANAGEARKGRMLFNGGFGCAHCHGPNAVSALAERDLRSFNQRYGERADEVFRKSVIEGRAPKGMPAWKGSIDDEQLARIKLYIDSVQRR